MDAGQLHFHARLSQHATRTEETLAALLPGEDAPLGAAMRYAVLSGGKRLRAFLALEAAALFHAPQGAALRAAAAVECLHAYSLVHDDLPCMDDDDLRRGKPTVHVRWDEATAVLVGDALQTFAFEILAAPLGGVDPRLQVRLIGRLAQAAGASGMAGGQALDIAAENSAEPLDLAAITGLQALKTGALIAWAAESGAVLGRTDPTPMRRYAGDLGLAFQIHDDILDVEGDPEAAGKRLRKDEGARRKAHDLASSACEALAPYGSAAETLRGAARFAVTRAA